MATLTKNIKQCAKVLQSGGLVAFPTETVYGLGAVLWNKRALKKIFKSKGRPQDNPLIVHIASPKELESVATDFSSDVYKLTKKFWPGPLTLVLRKKTQVPSLATAGLKTVAVRMPDHPIALKLIKQCGSPLAAPSANRSGRPSPTQSKHVLQEFSKNKSLLVLEGGPTRCGLESTVLDASKKPFRILRPGWITLSQIRAIVPNTKKLSKINHSRTMPSPGLKHAHYQPQCRVKIFSKQKLSQLIKLDIKNPVAILCLSLKIPSHHNIVLKKQFSTVEKFSKELYSSFFEAEKRHAKEIWVEEIPHTDFANALMDRLNRAAS